MPSSGKALVCNLVSSLPKVDPFVMPYHLEQIVNLNKLGILDSEISKYLLRTNYNVFFHDNLLLRNANFRKSDITSIFKNEKHKSFMDRLDPNENKVIKKYQLKVINHFCLHFSAISKKILFESFGNKLLYLQVLRSPITLTMINRISTWSMEIEKSKSRDGHIKIFNKKQKKHLPFFLKKKSEEYLKANKYERAIMIIESNFNFKLITDKMLSKKYKSVEIIIPFENIITNPKKYLEKISKYINSKIDKYVYRSFKKNNLPRNFDYNKEKIFTLKFLRKKIRLKYYNKLLKLENLYQNQILNKY